MIKIFRFLFVLNEFTFKIIVGIVFANIIAG